MKKRITLIVFSVLIIAALYVLYCFNYIPHKKYTNGSTKAAKAKNLRSLSLTFWILPVVTPIIPKTIAAIEILKVTKKAGENTCKALSESKYDAPQNTWAITRAKIAMVCFFIGWFMLFIVYFYMVLTDKQAQNYYKYTDPFHERYWLSEKNPNS